MAGTIRAFGGVDLQSQATPPVIPGTALGTKLSTRMEEFLQGKES